MSEQFQFENDESRGIEPPLVSIIINNNNYAGYLGAAVDSALRQDYVPLEVLVVDDGSTDRSRDVIALFGPRIHSILKPNGGQASALNAGFASSQGDIILFLDSDDLLLPSAARNSAAVFDEAGILNVRWPMWLIDSQGNKQGGTRPAMPPQEGNFREQLFDRGPTNVPSSPTSGNARARSFLECVFPIPENIAYYRKCADEYLYTLSPAFGQLRTIVEPQGCYRIHGRNIYSSRSFFDRVRLEQEGYDDHCREVSAALLRNGMSVDINNWKRHSWFHQLDRAVSNILQTVPENANLVLVEGGTWDAAEAFGTRNVRPFLKRGEDDWGPPRDSAAAIAELDCIGRVGMNYLAIGWPSFWWFDEYPQFFKHLDQNAACVLRNEDVVIYELKSIPGLAKPLGTAGIVRQA